MRIRIVGGNKMESFSEKNLRRYGDADGLASVNKKAERAKVEEEVMPEEVVVEKSVVEGKKTKKKA